MVVLDRTQTKSMEYTVYRTPLQFTHEWHGMDTIFWLLGTGKIGVNVLFHLHSSNFFYDIASDVMKGLFGTLGLSGKTSNAGNFIIFDADIYKTVLRCDHEPYNEL